jgi:ATPase family associated with various cellular activities (AAA)
MASLTETRTVTLAAAKREINICLKHKRPVFLWGPPGIGKSDIVAQITEDMNGKLYDLRLALMDPSDLKGVLYYNPAQGDAQWSSPPDLPSKEEAAKYPVVVLFLDEMNSAAPATQAAAYQLVLNRRVGTYELPDNCVIVAAGNRDTDRGVVYRMPSPLANRFVHLTLRPDFETWQTWAIEHMIHPDIIGYLTNNKRDLFDFDPKGSGTAFATPRSWAFVSQLLNEEMSDVELNDLVSGTVGEGVALKFVAHRKVAADLPDPQDILSGKVKELKNKDIGAMYSLGVSLCYELKLSYDQLNDRDNEAWHKQMDNVLGFILSQFDTEMTVMLVWNCLNSYKMVLKATKLKHFQEFQKRCGPYILAATASR